MSLFISPEGHDLNVVYRREDGSYVIDGGLYHVPNEGEYAGLWDYVNTYVNEHPESLSGETEPGVMFFDGRSEAEIRIDEIKARLHELSYVAEEIALGLASRADYADEIEEIAELHNELYMIDGDLR